MERSIRSIGIAAVWRRLCTVLCGRLTLRSEELLFAGAAGLLTMWWRVGLVKPQLTTVDDDCEALVVVSALHWMDVRSWSDDD